MKSGITRKALLIALSQASFTAIAEDIDKSELHCKMSGCTITCYHQENQKKTIGQIESINIFQYANGVTRFDLDRGIEGKESIIIGSTSYLCTIDNQK